MENSIFDPNTKLTAIYYNGGKPPHLFRIHTDVTSLCIEGSTGSKAANSTTKTHGGWTVLSIDVHRPTQPGVCGSVI